jgi:L-amino acid N-acyltransferase YncA
MQALIDVARQRGLEEMQGEILTANRAMLELVTALGFNLQAVEGDSSVRKAVKHLR